MNYDLEWHALTATETSLLEKLLSTEFPGRDALTRQVRSAKARWLVDRGAPALLLQVADRAEKAQVNDRVPVEGCGKDLDGTEVYLLLHVVDGMAKEVEIFRPDGQPVLSIPEAKDIEITAY